MVPNPPNVSLQAIEAGTRIALAEGHKVFQTHRYATTDWEHASQILDWFRPCEGACVLDAGCGIGEVARLFAVMRQDLSFLLANISPLQLSLCPQGERFAAMQCDCHALPLPAGAVDAVMFSSALCQMDAAAALHEARRVSKPGAVLLINDMERLHDDARGLELVGARTLTRGELLKCADDAGWMVEETFTPDADSSHFRDMLAQVGLGALAETVRPIVVRAIAV